MVTSGTPETTPSKAKAPSSSISSPPAKHTSVSKKVVIIDGVEYDLEPTPKTAVKANVATFTKAASAKMDVKEKTDLFERATAKKLQPKFTMMNLKIDDPDKLDDTYNLAAAIDTMKENHIKYDLHDVFKTVYFDSKDPTTITKTVDLYTDYGSVKVADVAKSTNRFCYTMIRDPSNAIHENLKLTKTYLVNNTDDNLVLKINKTYLSYPEEERGGPLFFKLLMDLLQNNSAEAAEYLINVVKNLKISNFDGENILKVVSLIRGAVKRLTNLKDATGQSALPKDMANHLLDVVQTSLVDDFNSLFKHFRLQSQIATFRQKLSKTPTIEEILLFAKNQYHLMSSTGKWTGVHAKANETVFVAALKAATPGTKFKVCFNCGGSHHYSKCPKPADQSCIKANKALFRKNKRGNGTGSPAPAQPGPTPARHGKFSPPTDDKKKNKSRRLIDGKLHWFHYKTQKWRPVGEKTTPSPPGPPTTVANPAIATQAQVNLTESSNLTPVISNQTRHRQRHSSD
jgi:hypothetical protein